MYQLLTIAFYNLVSRPSFLMKAKCGLSNVFGNAKSTWLSSPKVDGEVTRSTRVYIFSGIAAALFETMDESDFNCSWQCPCIVYPNTRQGLSNSAIWLHAMAVLFAECSWKFQLSKKAIAESPTLLPRTQRNRSTLSSWGSFLVPVLLSCRPLLSNSIGNELAQCFSMEYNRTVNRSLLSSLLRIFDWLIPRKSLEH